MENVDDLDYLKGKELKLGYVILSFVSDAFSFGLFRVWFSYKIKCIMCNLKTFILTFFSVFSEKITR